MTLAGHHNPLPKTSWGTERSDCSYFSENREHAPLQHHSEPDLVCKSQKWQEEIVVFCFPSRAQTEFRSRNILFASKPNPHKQYLAAQLAESQIFPGNFNT